MTTLGHERSMSGGPSPFPQLLRLVRSSGAIGDRVVRDRLARVLHRAVAIIEFLGYRAQTALSRGHAPGAGDAVIKLAFSQLATRMARLAVDVQGPTGMLVGDGRARPRVRGSSSSSASRRSASRRGRDEVQRNVLGERLLGLPAEPRADKDVPFRTAR